MERVEKILMIALIVAFIITAIIAAFKWHSYTTSAFCAVSGYVVYTLIKGKK